MGIDIYISLQRGKQKECLIHWHKYAPLAEWFFGKVYKGERSTEERELDYLALVFLHENCDKALNMAEWKKYMSEQLFAISPDYEWTGYCEYLYLEMMKSVSEQIDFVAPPKEGEKLLIQITY